MGEGGCSSVVGSGRRAAPDRAAFINGVAANALDYDGGVVLQGHYGGTVVFSALAVAELVDATGREFLEAIIAAYEVTTRIGVAIRPSLEHRRLVAGYGPHQGFAAVVTAGRLLKLDVERLVHAFGIYGASPRSERDAMELAKPASDMDERHGRVAVGVWDQRGNACEVRVSRPAHNHGGRTGILAHGSVGPVQPGRTARWARLPLRHHALVLQSLSDVSVEPGSDRCASADPGSPSVERCGRCGGRGWSCARASRPALRRLRTHNLVDAQFSLPYALAVILQGQSAGPRWYEPALFDSPAMAGSMRKVKLRFDEEIEELFFAKRLVAAKVKVIGLDGATRTLALTILMAMPRIPLRMKSWTTSIARSQKSACLESKPNFSCRVFGS